MPTLQHTLRMLRIPILEDGVISLGEAALLQRSLRPFIARGDAVACELRDLLQQVRRDGVVTREESERICRMLEKITDGASGIEQYVNVIPDFPKPGMAFHDTGRLLDTPWLFRRVMDMIHDALTDIPFDLVVSPEPRGVAFGAAVAALHGAGFVPVRGPGAAPREMASESYETPEGPAELQMHADAIMRGEQVVIIDDLLATGQTAAAIARLVKRLGGKVVKMVFAVELSAFNARETALSGFDVSSLVKVSGR